MKLYLFENAIHKPAGLPFPGYLIKTDDNKNVLIETGVTQTPILMKMMTFRR
jgi:hypothetical protein